MMWCDIDQTISYKTAPKCNLQNEQQHGTSSLTN